PGGARRHGHGGPAGQARAARRESARHRQGHRAGRENPEIPGESGLVRAPQPRRADGPGARRPGPPGAGPGPSRLRAGPAPQPAPAPAAGALAALPATEPVESPLSSGELASIVGALSNAPEAKHRPRVLSDAIERDTVRDLRILPFCVAALSDSGIGYVVEE